MALPTNRRSSRRLPPRGKVKIKCRKGSLDLGDNLAVEILDVSETGARLQLKKGLPLEVEVLLTFEASNSGRRIQRLAQVAWCSTDAEGAITGGFRFDKPLTYADLDHIAKS
jgi:hypothetical protein